jgi:hypothetical protein
MRLWSVICVAAAIVASGGAAQSQGRPDEDCALLATQSEQIGCLQDALAALRQQVQGLVKMREIELSAVDQLLTDKRLAALIDLKMRAATDFDGRLKAMIERKVREALEPRLQLLQRP